MILQMQPTIGRYEHSKLPSSKIPCLPCHHLFQSCVHGLDSDFEVDDASRPRLLYDVLVHGMNEYLESNVYQGLDFVLRIKSVFVNYYYCTPRSSSNLT